MVQKRKGRPALKDGKRSRKIDARFTEEEFKSICELEKALGLKKTDLVRMRLLTNSKAVVINARELISQLDQVGGELGRAGNNINQLAKHANILNKQNKLSQAIVSDFNKIMENYNRIQVDLETALRKVIRAMLN